jgi:hypothetical protein
LNPNAFRADSTRSSGRSSVVRIFLTVDRMLSDVNYRVRDMHVTRRRVRHLWATCGDPVHSLWRTGGRK